MRLATRVNRNRARTNKFMSLPAPRGGWNVRDSIADMAPTDAVILDNWIPGPTGLVVRRGYASHATGMSGTVETLMEWAGPSSQKMFAAVGANIYEVTSAGAVGAADVSSLTNGRWQHVNFGTSGGQFLVCCNGADAVRNYDGTSWTTPTLTGGPGSPAGADFIHVENFKTFLLFIEKDSLSFWYLPTSAISGTVTEFPVHSYTRKGGHLVAAGTWTLDSGSGVDDLLALITSEGEVLVYSGTDPGNDFVLIGRFEVGVPIGLRVFQKVGGDLNVITEDGYLSLTQALLTGRINPVQSVISDKIRGAVTDLTMLYGSNFGWQAALFPRGNIFFVNVPIIEGSLYHQHVLSLTTGSWCRFTGIPSACWQILGEDIYFGTVDTVYKFWSGNDDAGKDINTDVQQAFSDFRTPGVIKHWHQARPIIEANGTIEPALGMSVDYVTRAATGVASYTADNTALWDESDWDTTPWAADSTIQAVHRDVGAIGYAGGLRMTLKANDIEVKWHGTQFTYDMGDKF